MNTSNETTNNLPNLANLSYAELQNLLAKVKQQANEKKQSVQSVIAEYDETARYEIQNAILVVLNQLPDDYRQLIKTVSFNNNSQSVLIDYINTNKSSSLEENCNKITLQFYDGTEKTFASHSDVTDFYKNDFVNKLATNDCRYNAEFRKFLIEKNAVKYILHYSNFNYEFDLISKQQVKVSK